MTPVLDPAAATGLRSWWAPGGRARLGDGLLLAVLVAPYLVLAVPGLDRNPPTAVPIGSPPLVVIAYVLAAVAVLVRRARPGRALALGVVASGPVIALGGGVPGLVLMVLLHGWSHRVRVTGPVPPAVAVLAVGGGIALAAGAVVAAIGGVVAIPVLAVLVGAVTGTARRVLREHQRRHRARWVAAERARVLRADRDRIGEELHDVVARAVATAVATAQRSGRDRTDGAATVAAVAEQLREALGALRRMLVVLRAADDGGAGSDPIASPGSRGPVRPDLLLTVGGMVALVALSPLALPGVEPLFAPPSSLLGWLGAVGVLAATLGRTAAPSVALLVATVGSMVATVAPGGGGWVVLSVLWCLLAVAALERDPPRRSVPAVVTATVLSSVATLFAPPLWAVPEPTLITVAVAVPAPTAAVLAWGWRRRVRRHAAARVAAERAADWRRHQRLRIACDLHDLVAHHVSGMIVQTATAAALSAERPDLVDAALAHVRDAGHRTLAALPELLAVVSDRAGEGGGAAPPGLKTAGAPGTALTTTAIASLLAPLRAAGASVRVEETGAGVVDGPVAEQAHQVLREALTNVLRHAGPSATVVRIDRGGDGLHLDVQDAGPVAGHRPAPGGGFGLVGMGERAAMVGGTVRAGPHGSGWRVRLRLPAPESDSTDPAGSPLSPGADPASR